MDTAISTPYAFTDAEKTAYAEALLRYPDENDIHRVGLTAFNDATKSVIAVRTALWGDQFVMAEKARLVAAKGEESFLPPKHEFIKQLQAFAKLHEKNNPDVALKTFTLIADVRGFKQKAETDVNVNVTNRVMVVKSQGTMDEWEAKATTQQANLMSNAAGTVTH